MELDRRKGKCQSVSLGTYEQTNLAYAQRKEIQVPAETMSKLVGEYPLRPGFIRAESPGPMCFQNVPAAGSCRNLELVTRHRPS